jgi:CRP-like cAMP-binding protein
VTKKELAEMIGVQRTSLSRELAKMQADGILVCKGRTIEIKQTV